VTGHEAGEEHVEVYREALQADGGDGAVGHSGAAAGGTAGAIETIASLLAFVYYVCCRVIPAI
jgi:hypothetical protein